MKKNKQIVLAAMFLSLGIVLPLFTGQIKEIGDSLLPMHIPVMLCGIICGYRYGFFVGLVLPILRSLCFSMPPLYPNSVWMALELATYGCVTGFMYSRSKKTISSLYTALISAMLCGRIVWGIAKAILLGVGGNVFTCQAFITGGFIDAVPGIILQLVLIPSVITILKYRVKKEVENENN